MKKIFLILPILLFTITISKANAFYSQQQTVTRQVSDFSSIISKCSADIVFIQSNETKIKVVTKNFDSEKVVTKVSDSFLTIYMKNSSDFNFINNSSVIIYVYNPTLESVQLLGSGDFESKNKISGEDFDLSIRGSGDFYANMDMQNIIVNVNGSGDVSLSGIKNSLAIKINGSGDAKIKEVDIVDGKIILNGSGDISIEGLANNLEVKQTGSGDCKAVNLICNRVIISKNSSGDASITAQEEFTIRSSGSGDTYCYGNPAKVSEHTSGSGEVYFK